MLLERTLRRGAAAGRGPPAAECDNHATPTAPPPPRHRPATATAPPPLQRILIVEDAGNVYAVSNKCSHLGLPLQGKTAMFTAQVRPGAFAARPRRVGTACGALLPHGVARMHTRTGTAGLHAGPSACMGSSMSTAPSTSAGCRSCFSRLAQLGDTMTLAIVTIA